MELGSALAGERALSRSQHTSDEIREELERVAASLSSHDEDLELDFQRPERAGWNWPFAHNWDVRVNVPDGLENLAFMAIELVAARWDLREQ